MAAERCRAAQAVAAAATGGTCWLRSAPLAGAIARAEPDEPEDVAAARFETPAKDVARFVRPVAGCQAAAWVHCAASPIAKGIPRAALDAERLAAVRSRAHSDESHSRVHWAVELRSVVLPPQARSDVVARWAAQAHSAALRWLARLADLVRSLDLARPVVQHLRADCREPIPQARECVRARCGPVASQPDVARMMREAAWDFAWQLPAVSPRRPEV